MKLKKVADDWYPSENPYLKIGEVVEISDYTKLVKTQKAVLVDEMGNEIPLPGEEYQCGVCFKKISGSLLNYTNHVLTAHAPTKKEEVASEVPAPVAQATLDEIPKPSMSVVPEVTIPTQTPADILKAKRLAALEKARAVRQTLLNK